MSNNTGMEPTDLTIEILKSIRDEMHTMRVELTSRVDQTNERLDQMSDRIDRTNERLESLELRQSETEVRLATEIVAVVGAVNEVKELLAKRHELAEKVDDHERRIAAIESHIES